MVSTERTFEHWACVYRDDQQLLQTAVPFLAGGLEAGEPVLAVTSRANLGLIGAALGERAGEVDYAESAFFGRRPPQRVAAFYRYWTRHADARRDGRTGRSAGVRILAEPVWAGRSAREVAAWTRMESALNVALAPASISMVCPYDTSTLDPGIVADALRTHPAQIAGSDLSPSAEFGFDGSLRGLRRFIASRADAYGVAGDRAEMLILAVSEVGAYLKNQGRGTATVRTWEQPGAVVCDFCQPGTSISDPFLGLRPASLEPGAGDGLWLANQLCDWMEIRPGAEGCTIQLQVPSRHDQEMVVRPGTRYPA